MVRNVLAILIVPWVWFAFGVFTQIVYWDVLPLWYHLVAIAFILPVAMAGTNLVTRRCNTDQIA
jgi:hypothetical protein